MNRRVSHVLAAMAMIAVLLPAGARCAERGAGNGEIARAIAALSDADFGKRVAAQQQLLLSAPQAEAQLREKLKEKNISTETRERINYILDWVDVPWGGVVWRGRHGRKAPEGIQDGDIITALDGFRFKTWHEFWSIAGQKDGPCKS